MIVFEALNALYGDCLLLRYEDETGVGRLWVIDGGPRSTTVDGKAIAVWRDVLLPRLNQLNSRRPVEIDLGMVTHIDDDHINGLDALTAAEVAAKPHPSDTHFNRFWFNSLDLLLGTPARGRIEAHDAIALSSDDLGDLTALTHDDGAAVLQSMAQGNRLSSNLRTLDLDGNEPANGVLTAIPGQPAVVVDGAHVTIVGPRRERLDRLREDWEQAMRHKIKGARLAALMDLFAPRDRLDRSIPNLSSIVVLVEIRGKTILLTGDARGDDVVAAWQQLGLPDDKKRIDVLKIPHHGSLANNPRNFIEFFEPTHLVFSGDGHNDNPEARVVEGTVSVHHGRAVVLHFTNAKVRWSQPYIIERGGATANTLEELLKELTVAYPGPWTYSFRPSDKLSVEIELE